MFHVYSVTKMCNTGKEENEWMFNDTPAQNINRLLGVRLVS